MRSGENDTSFYKRLDELAGSTPFMYSIINLHMAVVLDMKKKELEKTLNWLLSMGIINGIEYNDLYMKSLPYVK